MTRLVLFIVFSAHILVGCGPEGSGTPATPTKLDNLSAKASCLDTDDAVCLNYISYPSNSTADMLQQTCVSSGGVWSNKACSQEDVFAQCRVFYMDGEVVTYFLPPKAPADAEATCENQDGTYKASR